MLWLGYPRVFHGRLSDWRAGVRDGWMPGSIFNATLVETGGPMLFSTVQVPRSDAVIFGQSHSAFQGADINLLTAVRLSASFAWVSPAAVARYDNESQIPKPSFHVVDGAYYDNYGVDSVVDWCWDALRAYGSQLSKIVIIQIRARPVVRSDHPGTVGLFVQALAPFLAATDVMTGTQFDRDMAELERLRIESGGMVDTVVFTAKHGIKPSWSLPEPAMRRIETDWLLDRQGKQMHKLRDLLSDEPAGAGRSATDAVSSRTDVESETAAHDRR